MNKKVKYTIFATVLGILIGFMGELFPDSLKTDIQGFFPIAFNISFTTAWFLGVIILVLLSIWFVWKQETSEEEPISIQSNNSQVLVNQPTIPNSSISSIISNNSNMTKQEVLTLIETDLDKAFEELDKVFEAKGVYLDLSNEYTSRPDNFVLNIFRSKLKRFVNINWK